MLLWLWLPGFVQSWILEKFLKIAQTWKKSGKMLKFRVLYKWNLFCFGQILLNLACTFSAHHEKSFVPESFKVSIDHVFDYLESGKRKYCFVKKSGNSLEFWIPKSVQTLHIYEWLDFLGVRFFRRIQKRICDLVWILHQQNTEDPKKDHLPR